jgi:hypothetical protein
MKNHKSLTLFAVLVYSTITSAQGAEGSTSIGRPDCGTYILSPSVEHKAWVLGYLSGVNQMLEGKTPSGKPSNPLGQLKSAGQIYLWMDNYCKKYPLENVTAGALALLIELRKEER